MTNIMHSYFEENKEKMFPLFFSNLFRKFDLQLGDIVGGIDKNVYNSL